MSRILVSREGSLHTVEEMPEPDVIRRRAAALTQSVFQGKKPAVGRAPRAVVTIGVQGAGKSTAIRKQVPASYVRIDPDEVTNILINHTPLPDGGPVYSLTDTWSDGLVEYAVKNRYDFVLDSAFPSSRMLKLIKSHGYSIEMLLVRTVRDVARKREVSRDLKRGWGRPGLGIKTHVKTRDKIALYGPALARTYCSRLTVCDNTGKVMHCTRRPSLAGTDQFFRM